MIPSSFIELLLNKYVFGSLAVLISLAYAYFKGHSAAKASDEADQLKADQALQARLRAAEAKNQFLEKKGEQLNGKITSADTIDSLISLFNEVESSKTPGSDASKESK